MSRQDPSRFDILQCPIEQIDDRTYITQQINANSRGLALGQRNKVRKWPDFLAASEGVLMKNPAVDYNSAHNLDGTARASNVLARSV
jgi:hypothetical protein